MVNVLNYSACLSVLFINAHIQNSAGKHYKLLPIDCNVFEYFYAVLYTKYRFLHKLKFSSTKNFVTN